MNKSKIINDIIEEGGFKSYLEIGYAQGSNFKAINVENKTSVDPTAPEDTPFDLHKMTSDEFFEANKKKFDVIFIDGLHEAEQVERDILNAWYSLKMGGYIVIHDILPFTEEMQKVPRTQEQWTGDVWRAWQGFCEAYGDKIETNVLPEKYGIGTIKKINCPIKTGFVNAEMTYNEYREISGK